MDVNAYYESLILDAVAQVDAPLHEALVRSSVYRTINDSYERALAQLVINGELLYANGEYSMAPGAAVEAAGPVSSDFVEPNAVELEAVDNEDVDDAAVDGEVAELEAIDNAIVDDEDTESEEAVLEAAEGDTLEAAEDAGELEDSEHVQPEADEVAEIESVAVDVPEPMDAQPEFAEPATPEPPAPMACGPISLRADSTLVQLKVNGRSWPIPVAVGVSYDKKPADGLSLMGYEPPTEPVATAEQSAEQQEPVQAEQGEPIQPGRPELTLSPEPQQLSISFSESIETAKAVAESEPVAEPAPVAESEQPALALECEPELANEHASVEEPEPELEAMPTSALEPSEDAVKKLERPKYLSGWDDPRCVFDTETQVAFLDKHEIHDVFCLVRKLGKAEDETLRTAFEKQLTAYALPLSPRYRAQVPELGKLSGNARLAFDVFGNLRSIGRDCRAFANVKGPITETLSTVYTRDGAPLSLWNLSITPAIQRKLKWNLNIYDLPELLTYSASRLRSGGLAPAEVRSIVAALKDWPAGSLQLARIKYEMELARQAAIGGWYPSVNTPVERAIAINRLADEAVLELRKERLSVNEPSFRLLFCTRLAGKLAEGYSEKYSVKLTLNEFKNEYPAFNAAAITFKRLNFEVPHDREDIDAADTDSACTDANPVDTVIAPASVTQPSNQPDAQAQSRTTASSGEPKRPQVQNLTVGQALKLAIDPDAAKFNRWFADLAYQDRTLMGYMLIENNPAKWAGSIGRPSSYIGVRYDVLMEGRPTFDVDTFGPLFHTYKLSAKEFYGLTQTAQPAFLYMKRVYGQGTIPLKYAQVDKDLAPSVCDVVRAYFASMETENADEPAEEKAAPVEQVVAPAPEPEPATELEPDQMPDPVALEPTTAPDPQQPAKPFTSKIEDLTGKGPMSIEAWLALLPADDADLLRWVFSDKPLMDYPRKPAGLGPLRRRRDDLISNRPQLDEDQFSSFYTCYDLTVETFCEITQASPMAFGYLKAIKVSNRFSLRRAANDPTLPQEWRDRIAQLHRRPAADTLRAPVNIEKDNASQLEQIARKKLGSFSTRGAALRAFAETGAVEEYHTLKDIRIKYQRFLDDNKCGFKQMLVMPSEDIKCLNELRGTGSFLVARGNKIRSYKIDNRLTSELRRVLTLAAGRNIECGAGLILRENKELCDLYDVRDDEELYEIIRTYVRPDTVHGLRTVVSPVIRLGETDRKRQMLDVLRDAGTELSREEFAQRYADKYCIDTKTVRSNYLRDMNAYLRNGRYSYVDSNLTDEQQQFIKDMVPEDYVSLPYVRASFIAKFGSTAGRLINDQTLAPLGLEVSRDLIVKKGVDLRKSFEKLLMSRDSFAYGAPGFGDEVINHQDFRLAIAQLLRNFTFIECNHGSFISLKHLEESVGIRRTDLSSYAYAVSGRTESGVPFTVASLRKQGFEHKLDAVAEECGFDEAFFDSIVVYGLPQEQIRRTRFGGTYMFCRKEGSFSIADAVEYVAKQRGPIGVDDLIDVFQDDYGVVFTAYDIIKAVKDKDLFYNEDLNMVMPNKEANAAYLRELYIKNNQ